MLTAVRVHTTGEYWDYDKMQAIARQWQVALVTRYREMEQGGIQQVLDEVGGWKYKEGVVVRMSDGSMVKVKSDWWFRAGYTERYRAGRKEWQANERERQQKQVQRGHTRGQRLAIIRAVGASRPMEVLQMFKAEKLEALYNVRGKLSVMVVSFKNKADMLGAQVQAQRRGWRAEQAYSRRTRGKKNRRIEVFRLE